MAHFSLFHIRWDQLVEFQRCWQKEQVRVNIIIPKVCSLSTVSSFGVLPSLVFWHSITRYSFLFIRICALGRFLLHLGLKMYISILRNSVLYQTRRKKFKNYTLFNVTAHKYYKAYLLANS